nr:uncharacterized protein LOC103454623 isoform X2 [Malus domestica]
MLIWYHGASLAGAVILDMNFCCFDSYQDKATWVVLYNGKSNNNEMFRILMHVFPSLLTSRVPSSTALLGKVAKPSLWHHRFAHPSNEILEAMLKVSSMSSSSDVITHTCSHCITGKMSRLAFSEKLDRVDIPFHKVNTDV